MKMVDHAVELVNAGWRVFPVQAGRKKPPLISNWHAGAAASTPDQVRVLWKGREDSNIGGVTGPLPHGSGLDTLDVDGEVGARNLRVRNLIVPATLTMETRPGRYQHFFRHVPGVKSRSHIFGKKTFVDTRGESGYAILPFSVHPEAGASYRWLNRLQPAEWTPELLDHVLSADESRDQQETLLPNREQTEILAVWQDHQRHDLVLGLAGAAKKVGKTEEWAHQLIDHLACLGGARDIDDLHRAVKSTYERNDVAAWKLLSVYGLTAKELPSLAPRNKTISAPTVAEVPQQNIEWLWPGRIAVGSLVVFDGDPGVNKSTVTIDLAARISTGRPLPLQPDGSWDPAPVLLLSGEDDAGTIKTRLDAAGGDPSLVRIVGADVDLGSDLDALDHLLEEAEPALVVVDPLMAFLGGRVDATRDQDVRRVLGRLSSIASQRRCAVVLVRHLTKATSLPGLYRGSGSIGIAGAARSVFLFALDPDLDDGRLLCAQKMNLAPRPPAIRFRITTAANGAPVVIWGAEVDITADEILAENLKKGGALDEARRFLRRFLAKGPQSANAVQVAAQSAGISPRTLDRAKKILRVESTHQGVVGQGGAWWWSLPSAPV